VEYLAGAGKHAAGAVSDETDGGVRQRGSRKRRGARMSSSGQGGGTGGALWEAVV